MWRVLVMEGDFYKASISATCFGQRHGAARPVATVEAAVELLDTTSVDPAILDVRLQNGLCFEFARTLVRCQVPIVFLTGSIREVVPSEFQAVPLLHKPFKPEILLRVLRGLLPVRGP